jgi:mono/diheme cytochrome c family protein
MPLGWRGGDAIGTMRAFRQTTTRRGAMKTWVRRSLLGLVAVVAVGAAAVAWGVVRSEQRLARKLNQPAYALAVPGEGAALDRGRYLFASRGCAECHGADGGGKVFIDGGGLFAKSPNISPGTGSVVARYQVADWERTLRHGIKPDGRPLLIMPSEDYNRWTDADVGAVVAYVRSLPPAAGGAAEFRLPLPVRVLYGYGLIKDSAEKIDHALPPSQPVPEGPTVEHGRYVAQMCVGCHGEGLSGGRLPGGPPDWPAAANLTPGEGSVLPRYADAAAFRAAMRSGKRPDGSAINPVMPFPSLREMSDVDLNAIHAYLQTVPPKPAGSR